MFMGFLDRDRMEVPKGGDILSLIIAVVFELPDDLTKFVGLVFKQLINYCNKLLRLLPSLFLDTIPVLYILSQFARFHVMISS